jgi:nanoRNase/pAp phosphatase (c-di-AMP/oligoRNAs hydrolase)
MTVDQIFKALAGQQEVLVIMHNDPDPDAIASAVGLGYMLEKAEGIDVHIAYRGVIGRAENRALSKYIGAHFIKLDEDLLEAEKPIALVDTQPGAGNQPLPPNLTPEIVVDHHSLREETSLASYADVRPEIGATSSIILEYLRATNLRLPKKIATALFYGIKTDTKGLVRSTSPLDVDAYFYLQSRIDVPALIKIESAQVPADYFKSYARALSAARVYGDVLLLYIGRMEYPDLGAEIADLLMRLEGTKWVICAGVYQKELILSLRSRATRLGAGLLAREIVGSLGEAGGHGNMAAGHISLNDADPQKLVDELFFKALIIVKGRKISEGTPLI